MTTGWDEMVKFLRCLSRRYLRGTDKGFIADFLKQDVPMEHLVLFAELEGVAGSL